MAKCGGTCNCFVEECNFFMKRTCFLMTALIPFEQVRYISVGIAHIKGLKTVFIVLDIDRRMYNYMLESNYGKIIQIK